MRRHTLAWIVAVACVATAAAGAGATVPRSAPTSDSSDHRASTPGGLTRNEPSVAVDPRHPNVVVTAANDDDGSSVAAYWSGDGGTTFSRRTPMPRGGGAAYESDPGLAFDAHGRLYGTYLIYDANLNVGGLAIARSDDGGRTWPATPTLIARNSLHGTRCVAHDFPSLAVDRRRDIVYVAWQQLTVLKDGGCTAGPNHPVTVVSSIDGGAHWSAPVRLAGLPHEIPFLPTLAVGPDGSIFVTFNSVSFSQTPAASATAGCPSSAPLHVLVASSHDHGRQFTTTLAQTACEDGTWIGTPVIGSSSYTGATWRLPSSTNTVVDPRTGVLVSVLGYQDGLTGHQRISLVTSRDHGAHWSAAGHVADLAGEEQQMPRLAVGADGRLSLVWIAQLPGGFTWPSHAWSRDDARTWSATQRISAAPNPRGGPGAQFFLGDYLGNDVGSDGRAHPVWTDPREIVPDEPGGTIYTRALVP